MKNFFTLLSVALLSVSAFAELAYNATLTQNDFNNNKTVISKIVPDGSEVVWEDDQIRCGGSSSKVSGEPAWDWDDKGVVIALAAGVPNQLSFQFATNNLTSTKGSTNWTAPDWYVDESADGSSWTNAWTTNSNSTSFSSKTVSLKTTTRFIRMYFSGNFAGYFKDIKVTEQILMGAPSPVELDFGTVKVDDAVEAQTFTINYTGMVPTASSSDTHFTVTPESFGSLYDYKKNQTITVGLKTNEAGEYNGTITVSGRSKSAEVAVSGKVEKYDQTISWDPKASYNYGEAIPVATATSGLDVSYEISNPAVLKFENGKFVTLYAGEAKITAKQAGNYKYNAAANVVKTIKIISPTTYGYFEKVTCDEAVEFNGHKYEDSFAGDVNVGKNHIGGDSIVHVNIVINHSNTGTDELEMTVGDDVEWNDIALKDSTVGVHTVVTTLTNAAGCDSIVTLSLTVNKLENDTVLVPLSFCAGGSEWYRGVEYKEVVVDSIWAIGETRDTLYVVNVTVMQPTFGTDSKTITFGDDIEWHGIALKDSTVGTHKVVYVTTNVAGCDSTVTLSLTVNKQETLELSTDIAFCEGDSAEYKGKWYYAAGTEVLNIPGETRDTAITVNVKVNELSYTQETMTIEYGKDTTWNEIALKDSVAGEYTLVYETTNVAGCDSIVTLTLTVKEKENQGGTTGMENIQRSEIDVRKFFRNGVMYIRREGKEYTLDGRLVK